MIGGREIGLSCADAGLISCICFRECNANDLSVTSASSSSRCKSRGMSAASPVFVVAPPK